MATDARRAPGTPARPRSRRGADYLDPPPAAAPAQATPELTHLALPRVRCGTHTTLTDVARRWQTLPLAPASRAALTDMLTVGEAAEYAGHIENVIGAVRVPVGLAGPLLVHGGSARGAYYVPLATTEATLVASYSRGAQLITEAGGCVSVVVNEGIGRAPGFAFASLEECGQFITWALAHMAAFRRRVERTTRHGRLVDMRVNLEGNHVYLHFEYLTGDAAGQNMVTLATEAICDYIAAHCPVQPRYAFLEANASGDKKASARSFGSVRGRKVTCEVTIPAELVRRRLRTTPERMADYGRMGAMGAVLTGTIGVQGHFANALAALSIATGQDAACVAEAAVGVTRLETTGAGDLYATVTLPNLVVGTVGGGTTLPSQRACLELMGLAGTGHARALAEVAAALCLAGELSLVGALCAGSFARAHRNLARGVARPAREHLGERGDD
ncbi:MAG TPA: hydroxymethylglutaryl-CoA reductase [Ktedonobacterales bacterium]|jgi:hydroxymethylglutaryl-CoA reductase (NADPH)